MSNVPEHIKRGILAHGLPGFEIRVINAALDVVDQSHGTDRGVVELPWAVYSALDDAVADYRLAHGVRIVDA